MGITISRGLRIVTASIESGSSPRGAFCVPVEGLTIGSAPPMICSDCLDIVGWVGLGWGGGVKADRVISDIIANRG